MFSREAFSIIEPNELDTSFCSERPVVKKPDNIRLLEKSRRQRRDRYIIYRRLDDSETLE